MGERLWPASQFLSPHSLSPHSLSPKNAVAMRTQRPYPPRVRLAGDEA